MRRFHAVIFDMDGLLLDTERMARQAFFEACEHFGIGEQPDLFVQCVGTNQTLARQVLKQGLHGMVDHLDFDRFWNSRYVESISNGQVPVKDGAFALLEHLQLLRIPAGVATSTKYARAMQKLRDAGLLDKFKAIVGGDQVKNGKPQPDIYLKAAAALGVAPVNCLALEDSENGVRSAFSAGMTVVQIPDLVEPSPDLRALGHHILGSLREVATHNFGAEGPADCGTSARASARRST